MQYLRLDSVFITVKKVSNQVQCIEGKIKIFLGIKEQKSKETKQGNSFKKLWNEESLLMPNSVMVIDRLRDYLNACYIVYL